MKENDGFARLQVSDIGVDHLDAAARHDQDVVATVDGVRAVQVDSQQERLEVGVRADVQGLEGILHALGSERGIGQQLAHQVVGLEEESAVEGALLEHLHLQQRNHVLYRHDVERGEALERHVQNQIADSVV